MRNVEHFIEIGIALSSEKNHKVLLEKIICSAMELSNADAGTIYSISNEKQLVFETVINHSLNIHSGGTTSNDIEYPNIPIQIFGKTNTEAMVAVAADTKQIINIDDVYNYTEYDLSEAKRMDSATGYKTRTVLTIPMTNHEDEVNGVIQLINAMDENNEIITFNKEIIRTVESLCSLAAVIVTNKQLIDNMEALFSSFSQLIATAIDRKSPYTGSHCRRVPEITMMLAKACHDFKTGPIADFNMTNEDFHELSVAAWLHDCGKVATPEYIMDKATKLSTICDRISLIEARFEIASRDVVANTSINDDQKAKKLKEIEEDRIFVKEANTGGEFFDDKKIDRIYSISRKYYICIAGVKQSVLSQDEITNLITKRGTLTSKERKIINDHMVVTVEMLEALPFPKHLKNVPEYACGHHEKMDGTGYPKGLKREQMSVPARIMAIADVFEALTANDRPYKKPKTLTETLTIMGNMKINDHLDPDLFDIFVNSEVYLDFANKFLSKDQIDDVVKENIPGFKKLL